MGRLKLWTFQQVQEETLELVKELMRSVSDRFDWESSIKIDPDLLWDLDGTKEWAEHENRLLSLTANYTADVRPSDSSSTDHETLDAFNPDEPSRQFSFGDRTMAIAKKHCEELNGIFDRAIESFSLSPKKSALGSGLQVREDRVSAESKDAPDFVNKVKTGDSSAENDPSQYGRWGGAGWQANPELGFRNHALIGEYFPRLSAANSVERCKLFAELAEKMYNSHAEMRLGLVRPGQLQDVSAFDDEHSLRCALGVWDLLRFVELHEAEKNAINFALAGCRSSAIAAAFKRVYSKSSGAGELLGQGQLQGNEDCGRSEKVPGQQLDSFPIEKWDQLEIVFVSDERLQLNALGATRTFNYGEIEFEDRRTGKPNQAWKVLRQFAEDSGTVSKPKSGRDWKNTEKAVQRLRGILQTRFGLDDDPFPFTSGIGYRACFLIKCSPSYNS